MNLSDRENASVIVRGTPSFSRVREKSSGLVVRKNIFIDSTNVISFMAGTRLVIILKVTR